MFNIMISLHPKEVKSMAPDDYVVQRWSIYYEIPNFNHFGVLLQCKNNIKSDVAFHLNHFLASRVY